MSTVLFTAVILASVIAIVATVIVVARDGYRPTRTDRSRLPFSDVAAEISAATARPYSSAIPARPVEAQPPTEAVPSQAAPSQASPSLAAQPQPEAAHTAVRRAARARGPRRATSAPKSPR